LAGTVHGKRIEIVLGDTLGKPGSPAAWFGSGNTGGVDAITDLLLTPIGAAVQQVAKDKSCAVMITATAISEFTSRLCKPASPHWADCTHALAFGTTSEVVKQGEKTWFFITVDYSLGKNLDASA
jgi:branched-chain amino acid transport system substrate-binding protein